MRGWVGERERERERERALWKCEDYSHARKTILFVIYSHEHMARGNFLNSKLS